MMLVNVWSSGIEDKVAVITASAHGIGRAAAFLFASRGAKVVVTGRDSAAGLAVVELIEGQGRYGGVRSCGCRG
jgi:NAD(P)-dependent dehydrogenase (short-subunit alcohol dehydrogenase family)